MIRLLLIMFISRYFRIYFADRPISGLIDARYVIQREG